MLVFFLLRNYEIPFYFIEIKKLVLNNFITQKMPLKTLAIVTLHLTFDDSINKSADFFFVQFHNIRIKNISAKTGGIRNVKKYS